ncbi:hypothetical protein OG585_27775 [Streptomyces sp. NBC_01340]|uniref:hypothetical protein n=1 Tax=unclassified Streptomyces TaxID=2593676 RepID=UPI00224E02DB|nr:MULTISPECIES: hypothetical protein [unclassified Streptomyces]MCX4456382.1 hypothetical protein [Streptomyces sp. NBC_01719]MCX4495740.1 hypothetical protein [Streptomyces sp. NBC_01728]WSI40690.1 hypothetical protein OG585_27775 [Streptomyces sp. NBC_01340]
MARHARQQTALARTTARIAVAAGVVAAGAAAAATPAVADAAPAVDLMRTQPTSLGNLDPQAGLGALTGTVGYATGPLAGLKPNPLAGTGVDPLDNGVGTQLADFKPLTSRALTGPLTQAPSVGSVPVVGRALGLLGGS